MGNVLAVTLTDGQAMAAMVTVLSAIAAGAWKLISDAGVRVDGVGKEQRDRLEAENANLRVENDRLRAERDRAEEAENLWRDRYYACVRGGDST